MVDVKDGTPFMDDVGIYVEGLREGKYHQISGVMNLYFAGFDGIIKLESQSTRRTISWASRRTPRQARDWLCRVPARAVGQIEGKIGIGPSTPEWMGR